MHSSTANTTAKNTPTPRYWRLRYAPAPWLTAREMRSISGVPTGSFFTRINMAAAKHSPTRLPNAAKNIASISLFSPFTHPARPTAAFCTPIMTHPAWLIQQKNEVIVQITINRAQFVSFAFLKPVYKGKKAGPPPRRFWGRGGGPAHGRLPNYCAKAPGACAACARRFSEASISSKAS